MWFLTVLLKVRLKLRRREVGGAVLCCVFLLWLYNTVGVTKFSINLKKGFGEEEDGLVAEKTDSCQG